MGKPLWWALPVGSVSEKRSGSLSVSTDAHDATTKGGEEDLDPRTPTACALQYKTGGGIMQRAHKSVIDTQWIV